MFGLFAGTKESDRCRDVAVAGDWTVSASYLGRQLFELYINEVSEAGK